MISGIFKAYDVRGVFPEEINEDAVARIGAALGKHFRGKGGRKKTVVVGRDARLSSPALYAALIKALQTIEGLTLLKSGLITTPMLYFLVNDEHAEGGVMVTASHNPKAFNGLKVVGRGAVPIPGTEIKTLLDLDDSKR